MVTCHTEPLDVRNSRGLKLASVVHLPAGRPRAAWAVISHGMLSTKDSDKHLRLAMRLCAAGFAVERHDFSGQGESEGDPGLITYTNGIDDLECVLSALERQGAERFVLIGSSMGSGVSILTAARRPGRIAAMALMACIAKTGTLHDRLASSDRERWRRQGSFDFGGRTIRYDLVEDGVRYDLPGALGRFGGPVLFVHGTADELIPIDDVAGLATCHPGEHELVRIDGADHRFSAEEHRERAIGEIVAWAGVFRQ